MAKATAVSKFVCNQLLRLMSHNRNTQNKRGNTTAEKLDAAELTFSAPLPNKGNGMPNICNHTTVLGVPFSNLQSVKRILMEKHRKLTAGEKGVY